MKYLIKILIVFCLCFNLSFAGEENVLEASNSLQLIIRMAEGKIPPVLIKRSQAIAVFPGVTKIGLLLGGMFGEGVLSRRMSDGWSTPTRLELKGGSFGFQLGYENSDIVLFILKPSIAEDMIAGKITLGVDASVSAGPLSQSYEELTDLKLTQDIYAYATNSGLFAGAALSGVVISIDEAERTEPSSYAARTLVETIQRLDK